MGLRGVGREGNNDEARTLLKIVRTHLVPLSQSIMFLEEALVVWDSVLAEDETNLDCQNWLDLSGVASCERRARLRRGHDVPGHYRL